VLISSCTARQSNDPSERMKRLPRLGGDGCFALGKLTALFVCLFSAHGLVCVETGPLPVQLLLLLENTLLLLLLRDDATVHFFTGVRGESYPS